MKRLANIFLLLTAFSLKVHGQSIMIGTDITGIVFRKCLCISASHGFDTHWSADIRAHLDLSRTRTGKDAAESGLNAETGIRYWPMTFGKGAGIGAGISYCIKGRADAYAEAGYSMRIWKGLTATMTVRTRIRESMTAGHLSTDHIKLELSYVF